MIITFVGHSSFVGNDKYEKQLLLFLSEIVGDDSVEMYLGDYGMFDSFAYNCCKKYKKNHPNVTLAFVTPYLGDDYINRRLKYNERVFDTIVYPPIENAPKRFAITYRNQYMVDQSDCIVCYVTHRYGGAYKTYSYAKRNKKFILNLGELT